MRLKQTTLALLLLAASPAMAQSPKGGEPYKVQRLQIEQLYDLLGRVQQLTDSVAQEREALGKQKELWLAACEECLSKSVGLEKLQQQLKDQKKPWHTASEDSLSKSEDQEKLQQLLKLTLRDVDGDDLFKRLQNALAKPAANVKDPAAADKKDDKGKDNDKAKANKKNKSKDNDKANGKDSSEKDGKSADEESKAARGTGEVNPECNDGETTHDYPIL